MITSFSTCSVLYLLVFLATDLTISQPVDSSFEIETFEDFDSQESETTFDQEVADIACTGLETCMETIEKLREENNALRTQLKQCQQTCPTEDIASEEETSLNDQGQSSTKRFTETFTSSELGNNVHSFNVSGPGHFFGTSRSISGDTFQVYLSSSCECDSPSEDIPPTSSHSCNSYSGTKIDWAERASNDCIVYVNIYISNNPVETTVWFFPLETLNNNTLTSIEFPQTNSYRGFFQAISDEYLPATFYIRAFGSTSQDKTNIYVTANCISSCFKSNSFTELPSPSSYCWNGITYGYSSGPEASVSLEINSPCKIYYSIFSAQSEESVKAQTWLYKTASLSNSTQSVVTFPFGSTLRYFVQNINATQDLPFKLYIRAFGVGSQAKTNIYVSASCISSCFKSNSFTKFPSSSSYCWNGVSSGLSSAQEASISLDISSTCEIYYSIYSTQSDESVKAEVWLYKTTALPNDTQSSLFFPFDGALRHFTQEVNVEDLPVTFYIRAYGTKAKTNIYVTANCSSSCLDSASFTEFPSSSYYCWAGLSFYSSAEEAPFYLEIDSPCKIFYSIYSTLSEESVKAQTWLYKTTTLPTNTESIISFPFNNAYRYFIHTVNAEDLPYRFYIKTYGIGSQAQTNIYVTMDCISSCFESSSFTQFPDSTSNCWVGVSFSSSAKEASLDLQIDSPCNIYYSIYSTGRGKSVGVTFTNSI